MVEIGSIIKAQVCRIEQFGIFLQYGQETVLVLVPEVSWQPEHDLERRFTVGQTLAVYVLRYDYRGKVIVGSLRRRCPEENPFRKLARLEPGTRLRGQTATVYGDDVRIELPDGAWGYILKNRLKTALAVGDEVEVTIIDLEVDEGRLYLDLVRRVVEPLTNGTLQALADSPSGATP